jgi:arylformamidase
VGIDYLSIAPFTDTEVPHQLLLSNEVVILEGLNLANIKEGLYQLTCLPLKIPNCDGAPARAILTQ